ncbi:MAG: electron transport complex protein RnfG [Paraglaciecola sp.]|jgi:electron transport complex protein RnfG
MKQTMTKNGLILALFALITTGLIALTFYSTKDQISAQEQQKLLAILNAVVDRSSYTNDIQLDCALVTSAKYLGSAEQTRHIYRARNNEQPVAVAIETTAPDGYNGKIRLVVGVVGEGTVNGVRVLKHKETPGLGDKIDLRISDWILSFNNLTLSSENISNWAVKKDGGQFDQFTGATITPRAVVNAVKLSVEYYQANKNAIFAAPNGCNVAAPESPKGQ